MCHKDHSSYVVVSGTNGLSIFEVCQWDDSSGSGDKRLKVPG